MDSNQCCLRERTHRLSSEAMILKSSVSKGGRATRPPLQPHRINVGESPTLRSRSIAQTSLPSSAFFNSLSLKSSTAIKLRGNDPKKFMSKGGRATRPHLQLHRINVGESPSFTATQDRCGRVAHTPIAVNGSNKPPPAETRSRSSAMNPKKPARTRGL